MASAHLSAQFISRGSGHSAVAKAAYNARAELTADREGETYDYSRHRSKCIFEGIYAPKDAPDWTRDRAQLWNHVEAFEKHKRAELAQEVNIALPHELTPEQNRWLVQDWVKENVTRKGLIADVAIHAPDPRGDARNIHAHVMIVRRKLDGSEFVRTKERFDTFGEKQAAKEADLVAMRGSWEKLANKALERHGHEARIDMGRKHDGEPTIHLGKTASRLERQGIATDRGDHNREIEAGNDNRREIEDAERKTLAELEAKQSARLQQRGRDAAVLEAEDTPQHRQARPRQVEVSQAAEPAKAPPQRDQAAADMRNALEALALTDPMRFAAAASAAREAAYRPTIPGYAPPSPAMPLEVEPDRSRMMEPSPARASALAATAKPVKPLQLGVTISYTIPTPKIQPKEPAREAQAGPSISRGTNLPAPSPEASQRPSYEAKNPIPVRKPVKWHEKAIQAGRLMVAQLGDRLDHGIEVFRDLSRVSPERERVRTEPQLAPAPDHARKTRADLGKNEQHVFQQKPRQAAPTLQPRPHVRVTATLSPVPTPQKRESVRRQSPAHAPQPVGRIAQARPAARDSVGRIEYVRPVQRVDERGPSKTDNQLQGEASDRLKQAEAEREQRQADRQEEWQEKTDLRNALCKLEREALETPEPPNPQTSRTAWDELIHLAQEDVNAKEAAERLQGILPRDDDDLTRERSR